MTATRIPPPPFNTAFLDGAFVSSAWQFFITALYNALYGGGFDKVDAAHALASAAVPQTTQVVAAGGLHHGGALDDNVGLTLYRAVDLLANLPATGNAAGDLAYAMDGRKTGEGAGAGTGVPCWWTPGAPGGWYAVDSGTAVTA